MGEAQQSEAKPEEKPAGPPQQPMVHRVCIACNNMFLVPFDHYDAKHCPVCHKG
jgi:hypothetical protein